MDLNHNAEVRIEEFGDGRRCAIVDGFLADPQHLVEYACAHASEFRPPSVVGYPGPGLTLPVAASDAVAAFVRRRLTRHFPVHRAGVSVRAGLFNLTRHPEALSPFQRLPHLDPRLAPGKRTYAGIVYLFADPALGGTAFYRWKRADVVFRALDLDQRDPGGALRYLAEQSAVFREPPRYLTASNDLAELLWVVPARFNRLVFYDGESPHSGHITAPDLLTEDLSRGRLTLNFFASAVPDRTGG